MMGRLCHQTDANRFSSFLLRYQPGVASPLPLISPIAINARERNRGRCSAADLLKAFEMDPSLSAKLLSEANSPVFNHCHHIGYTIHEAFKTVGAEHALKVLHDAPCSTLIAHERKNVYARFRHVG